MKTFVACLVGAISVSFGAFAQKDYPSTTTPRHIEVPYQVSVRGNGNIVSYLFDQTDSVLLNADGESVAGTPWEKRSRTISAEELKQLGYRKGEYETFQRAIRAAALKGVEVTPIDDEYRLWVNMNVYDADGRLTFQGGASVKIIDDGSKLKAEVARPYIYLADPNITVVGWNLDWALVSENYKQKWFSINRDGSFNATVYDFNTGTLIAHSRGEKGDSGPHALSVQLGQSSPIYYSGRLVDIVISVVANSDEFNILGDDLKLPVVTFWRVPRWEGDIDGTLYGKYPVLVYTPTKSVTVVKASIAALVYQPSGDKESILPVSIDIKDVRSGSINTVYPKEDGSVEFNLGNSSYQFIPHFEGVKTAEPRG